MRKQPGAARGLLATTRWNPTSASSARSWAEGSSSGFWQAWRRSTRGQAFERPPSSVRDPDAADIDRLTVSLVHFMSYRYEPSASEADKHPVCETVSKHQRFGDAI